MENKTNKKGLSKTGLIISAACFLAVLALIAAIGLLKPGAMKNPDSESGAVELASPVYPEMPLYPEETGRDFEAQYEAWYEAVEAQRRELEFSPELEPFFRQSISTYLSDAGDENRILSPLNLYMSLSMLSELTDGESREEIMSALNCPDMDVLRSRAAELWNANYRMDGATSLKLANSLWLRDDMDYKEDPLRQLSDTYYASAFAGEMGSPAYDELLQSWLGMQTEGMLEKSAGSEGFDENTVMALSSAICYRAKWMNEFSPENTAAAVFHGAQGDRELDFLNRSFTGQYYWGQGFGAVTLPLANGGGSMKLILPDEGCSPQELLNSGEALDFVFSTADWENNEYIIINLSLPKFDVESSSQLKDMLGKIGIERIFSQNADFSPLCDAPGLFLSQANHAARVTVDEEGVSAAAYTLMAAAGAGRPPEEEIDFTLDRPFIFVINSPQGQPLFAGLINNP